MSDNIGHRQLQELYFHVDNVNNGTQCLAWYGQLRAQEIDHAEALRMTVEHFNLASKDWYISRMRRTT
jgi:hypothetical protein